MTLFPGHLSADLPNHTLGPEPILTVFLPPLTSFELKRLL